MLHDHDRTGALWSGICDGCLAAVWPHIAGSRVDAEAELARRGWELVAGGTIRCADCSRRARDVKLHNQRGQRTR